MAEFKATDLDAGDNAKLVYTMEVKLYLNDAWEFVFIITILFI